jgi:26S proteasome regulatory subunit T5
LAEVQGLTDEQLTAEIRQFESNTRTLKAKQSRLQSELKGLDARLKENNERLKLSTQLPHLISNIGEILDVEDEEAEDENINSGKKKMKKALVLKTSARHTIYLPVIGLVEPEDLKPGELVAVNKESFVVYEKLPAEYDSRVKAMEVDERPTEEYSDIGGLDKQIEELVEAIVLPMTHKERFDNIGIRPPKGLLLHGPPGTGKTLMARACAAQTKATFLKLAGPQLVQMYIGDGAKMIRDAFDLAREKKPAIIFIDELDAIGTKRGSGEGESREVHRTMLELLNQLDGFTQDDSIKVIAATNRPDILDPALLRSGRLDRKVELPLPNEEARARIMQIHSRKMNVNKDDVNFEELARSTQEFNGAQMKAVCVEAGMVALRRDAAELRHEDFVEGIAQVQAKKKASLNYYA